MTLTLKNGYETFDLFNERPGAMHLFPTDRSACRWHDAGHSAPLSDQLDVSLARHLPCRFEAESAANPKGLFVPINKLVTRKRQPILPHRSNTKERSPALRFATSVNTRPTFNE